MERLQMGQGNTRWGRSPGRARLMMASVDMAGTRSSTFARKAAKLELLIELMEVFKELLLEVDIKIMARDALVHLLAEPMVWGTATVVARLLMGRLTVVLATVSLEAAFALALKVGSIALEPTMARGKDRDFNVWRFRRTPPPTKFAKQKTK